MTRLGLGMIGVEHGRDHADHRGTRLGHPDVATLALDQPVAFKHDQVSAMVKIPGLGRAVLCRQRLKINLAPAHQVFDHLPPELVLSLKGNALANRKLSGLDGADIIKDKTDP